MAYGCKKRTWANAVVNAKEVQRFCIDIYNISRGSIESNFLKDRNRLEHLFDNINPICG